MTINCLLVRHANMIVDLLYNANYIGGQRNAVTT